ncbi:MAG: porin family protein [Pseudomonadales bacterium]|nr:porin family protein [Pseudomonadales bacterium]
MNKKITSLAFAALAGATGHAFAEAPSFNYVQFDYVISGDTEVDPDGVPSETLDLQRGLGIQGAFEIGDYVMVMGRHMALDYEDETGITIGSVDNAAVNDMTFIGVGAHMPLADMLDIYGAVGFSRPTFVSVAGEGYGLEIGARANFEMVTASLWYNMGRTDTKAGTDTIDIDPELLGLDVAIEFAPEAPQLVLGYVDATNELELGPTTKADINYDHFSIGVRQNF